MRTLHTLTRDREDGGHLVVDYVLGGDVAGWYVHEFDPSGDYVGVGPCTLDDLASADCDSPETAVQLGRASIALRRAAESLEQEAVLSGLLARHDEAEEAHALAATVRADRRELLERLLEVCESAWARGRAELAAANEGEGARTWAALRTVEIAGALRRRALAALRAETAPRRPEG